MSKSENLYSAARELIPGGVNSPVRAFTGVGGTPLFIERADGAYLYDVDGKAYIDYVGSWGPMVLGHNHPAGDAQPSHEDIELTYKIASAGKLLDIRCNDHIVVGGTRFFSFLDEGLLA